ncbi:MAG: class I SAM-dependent methyltransferase [Candidatus Aminicenantes bacterium]|nr:class I SAM-dependent methyltransferase [Candidatus Aminicenantes bacterium]
MPNESQALPSSFRDPSGFLFEREGSLYRQVNFIYKDHYDQLLSSGLYKALTEREVLVHHDEVEISPPAPQLAYKIIKPRLVSFISYPYEWCFTQLKEAALVMLKIQKTAFDFGMSLKDASAFNIQFIDGRPLLVDTLSFEKLHLKPWVAYRQFCQHFLNPLLLMAYKDFHLNQLSRIFIDGIPMSLTSRLLPFRTRFRPSLASHVHLHALSQKYFSKRTVRVRERRVRPVSLAGLAESLESLVRRLGFPLKKTEWAHYYQETNYTPEGFEWKKKIIEEFLDVMKPDSVWDLGANTGVFSRLASRRGIKTVAFDVDFIAVELNYRDCLDKNEKNLLPLLMDLTNPTPAIGWENRERKSLLERGPADAVFALALLHHLAISNNLPFPKIAEFLSRVCRWLVIEFVPKTDSQVQRLLATREDIFDQYTQPDFEREFNRFFVIEKVVPIKETKRTLYLMKTNRCP